MNINDVFMSEHNSKAIKFVLQSEVKANKLLQVSKFIGWWCDVIKINCYTLASPFQIWNVYCTWCNNNGYTYTEPKFVHELHWYYTPWKLKVNIENDWLTRFADDGTIAYSDKRMCESVRRVIISSAHKKTLSEIFPSRHISMLYNLAVELNNNIYTNYFIITQNYYKCYCQYIKKFYVFFLDKRLDEILSHPEWFTEKYLSCNFKVAEKIIQYVNFYSTDKCNLIIIIYEKLLKLYFIALQFFHNMHNCCDIENTAKFVIEILHNSWFSIRMKQIALIKSLSKKSNFMYKYLTCKKIVAYVPQEYDLSAEDNYLQPIFNCIINLIHKYTQTSNIRWVAITFSRWFVHTMCINALTFIHPDELLRLYEYWSECNGILFLKDKYYKDLEKRPFVYDTDTLIYITKHKNEFKWESTYSSTGKLKHLKPLKYLCTVIDVCDVVGETIQPLNTNTFDEKDFRIYSFLQSVLLTDAYGVTHCIGDKFVQFENKIIKYKANICYCQYLQRLNKILLDTRLIEYINCLEYNTFCYNDKIPLTAKENVILFSLGYSDEKRALCVLAQHILSDDITMCFAVVENILYCTKLNHSLLLLNSEMIVNARKLLHRSNLLIEPIKL